MARVFVTSNAELAATKPYLLERITPVTLVLHGNIVGGSTLQFRQWVAQLHRKAHPNRLAG